MDQDEQHLNILAILHYVFGGLGALIGCLPLLYVLMGILFLNTPPSGRKGGDPPQEMAYFFIVFGAVGTIFVWLLATLAIISGRFISGRKHHLFCIIVAGVCCLQIPLGTILGIFTIIVLIRPTVKKLFEQRRLGVAYAPSSGYEGRNDY